MSDKKCQIMNNLSKINSRRHFLQRAFATITAIGTTSITKAEVSSDKKSCQTYMKKVIVGAHPWVYAATQPNHDITPILKCIFSDMSYAGMDGIELMHTALRPKDSVENISKLSQTYKLPIIGTSFGGNMWDSNKHDSILKDAEIVVGRLAKLGGRTLGTSVGHTGKIKTQAQLDNQAEVLRKIISLCESHGVVLNLHNHTYEVINKEHDLKGTLSRIPDVKLGPDINWLIRAGVNTVDFIKKHGQKIVFLHLRDQKLTGQWSEALGEGDTDFTAIAAELKKNNFVGDAVIELAHQKGFKLTRPLRESLKISREFVRKIFEY